MKLTKKQKEFLENLRALNTKEESPNVLQVASATEGGLSWGQALYRYRICDQLISMGLVRNSSSGRVRELHITEEGLQALEEER
mgnify:FL=1|jgi:predicted transcriptional regulator